MNIPILWSNKATALPQECEYKLFIPFFLIFIFTLFYFTILYWFCHTLTWIHHGCTCVPKHEPPPHRPPHNVSLGHHRAPAPSMLYPALDIDWQFNSILLFNMLSRTVITFLPRSKRLLISWLQSPSTVILEAPPKIVCHYFHCFPILPFRFLFYRFSEYPGLPFVFLFVHPISLPR